MFCQQKLRYSFNLIPLFYTSRFFRQGYGKKYLLMNSFSCSWLFTLCFSNDSNFLGQYTFYLFKRISKAFQKKKKHLFCIVTINDIPANKKTLFQGRKIGCIDVVSSHEWSGLTHLILALDRFFNFLKKQFLYFPEKTSLWSSLLKKKISPIKFLILSLKSIFASACIEWRFLYF